MVISRYSLAVIGSSHVLKLSLLRQIFARDVGTAPPAPVLKVVAVNVPVKLQSEEQEAEIRPGDYLIADMNGVVVLPAEVAEQALPLMKKQVEADDQMAVEIKKGMSFTEASKKFR
jgi:regulator of RNase E activity RraA